MIHQGLCEHKYWLDYPRCDLVRIEKTSLTQDEKRRLRLGEFITKRDRAYLEFYDPLEYDRIEE